MFWPTEEAVSTADVNPPCPTGNNFLAAKSQQASSPKSIPKPGEAGFLFSFFTKD